MLDYGLVLAPGLHQGCVNDPPLKAEHARVENKSRLVPGQTAAKRGICALGTSPNSIGITFLRPGSDISGSEGRSTRSTKTELIAG